jgi:hypothetical protein
MVRKPSAPAPSLVQPTTESAEKANTLIYYAALAFIYLACIVFVFTAFRLYRASAPSGTGLGAYYPELLLCGIAALLRSVGLATVVPGPVVNPGEWEILGPQVKVGKEEPVTQYIRLRSLSGFPGTFTKLGLTGLPLATIGLTIFFSLLYLKNAAYLDLAKLTLGAFIGSFVQKQIGERQGGGGVVELPSGERLKVQSAPPPTIA